MVLRRELLKAALLAAVLLVLLPAAAMATPRWLGGEPLEGSAGSAPRVAADADGNAVAVWLGAGGGVNAAYRPRGGPWGASEDLDPGTDVVAAAPRVTVQPDGEFVAVWVAERGTGPSYPLRWARRPAGQGWSPPATIAGIGCCPGISALQASADGSVLVVSTDEGTPISNRKPGGSETWGVSESIGTGTGTQVAVAPDGSAVAANAGSCSEVGCIRAAYRPAAGPWAPETAALTGGANVTGVAVAAGPGSSYTVVWAENTRIGQATGPPGAVRSSDRSAGTGGVWDDTPTLVADLPDDSPGCPLFSFGCIDLATGGDGAQVAVWQQAGSFGDIVGGRLRSAGGDWAPGMERVGDTGAAATSVAAAITTGGVPVAAWPDRSGGVALGAIAAAPGIWFATPLGPAAGSVDLDDLAVDGDGNAVTAWTGPSGASAAGFDGGVPRISSVSVPATGTAGVPLAFSAAAHDAWSGVSISWLFGDGGSAAGNAVNHAYGAAGTFTATATATDGVGNASQRTGSTTVAAAPDPCGTTDRDRDGIKDACDANDGSRRPVAFKTVNATVVSGDVFIKLPAGAARAAQGAKPPKGFVRLQGANTIPVGSTLDTARGRVKLRSASDTRKHVQSGEFFRGRFVIRQVRKPRGKARQRSTKLITVLKLTGSSFSKTCRRAKASTSARRRSRKRVRRLFGDGKGSFRTTGRNAAATVRGTRWSVQDRCDGTLVTVQRGRVSVRDLVRHKTVQVKTGHTYLARRR